MGGGGGEDLTTFRCGEDSGLAEHIATPCQSLAGHRRDHLLTEQPHILGAFAAILRRHLVRAQKCRNERGGQLAGESTNHAELFQLGLQFQAIAPFPFYVAPTPPPYSPQTSPHPPR